MIDTLPTILKSQATVRFQDCDPYGHLYNSKFIDYFMNAREDQVIEAYEMDIYWLAGEEGVGWVVAQTQIAYLKPAELMEKVDITTKIIRLSPGTLTVEFQMLRQNLQILKAVMWSRFVHIDIKKGTAIRHRAQFQELYAEVLVPLDETQFEARVASLKRG